MKAAIAVAVGFFLVWLFKSKGCGGGSKTALSEYFGPGGPPPPDVVGGNTTTVNSGGTKLSEYFGPGFGPDLNPNVRDNGGKIKWF